MNHETVVLLSRGIIGPVWADLQIIEMMLEISIFGWSFPHRHGQPMRDLGA